MTQTFITGSSGVLGFELLERLSGALDGSVTGVSRRGLPVQTHGLTNIEVPHPMLADWLPEGVPDATVVHCAGLSDPIMSFDDLYDLHQREILPHAQMVERMVQRGWNGHLVYISSGGAIYGDTDVLPIPENLPQRPKSHYALTKANVENILTYLARRYGFRLTILRISNSYGTRIPKKGQGVIPILIGALRRGETFRVLGTGDELRDYVHIDDIAAAVCNTCLVTLPEGVTILNIGSGVGTSVRQLIGKISDIAGRTLEFTTVPSDLDVKSNVLDISRARRLLTWEPTVSIDEGIARFMATAP